MNRIKCVFAALCLAAVVGIVPQSQAQTVKVMIAGSSAMWQTLALGAYNNGTSIVTGGGTTFHYTGSANFNLTDSRSTVATVDTQSKTLETRRWRWCSRVSDGDGGSRPVSVGPGYRSGFRLRPCCTIPSTMALLPGLIRFDPAEGGPDE